MEKSIKILFVILGVLFVIVCIYILVSKSIAHSFGALRVVSQQAHKTEKYHFDNDNTAVVRRGFDFKIKGDLGDSQVSIQPPNNVIKIKKKNASSIVFTTDVTAPLSKFVISITSSNKTTDITVYVIFNPYNKDDPVYMNKKDKKGVDLLDEYILNEYGIVFVGETPQAWHYGQFDQNTFVTVMDMILSAGPGDPGADPAIPDPPILNDPVSVSRWLSWAVGNTILSGYWPTGQDFYSHTSPNYHLKIGGPKWKPDISSYPDTPLWTTPVSCETNDECRDPKVNKNSYNNLCTPTFNNVCTVKGIDNYNDWSSKDICDPDPDNPNNIPACKSYTHYKKQIKKDKWDPKYLSQSVTCTGYLSETKTCGFTQAPNDWNNDTGAIYDQVVANSKVYDDVLKYGYPDKNSYMPAAFGQCWVIASALLSACRTIGIPCRQITNVGSAHDSQYCIDNEDNCLYWQGNFKPIMIAKDDEGNYKNGMVWNFHAWNDVWMKRSDLGSDYDGWQGLDSTIQENSMGVSRMGPAPLVALQRGETNTLFDVPFLNSEVNWKIKTLSGEIKDTGGGTVYTGTPNMPIKYYSSKNLTNDEKVLDMVTTILNDDYKPPAAVHALKLFASPVPTGQDDIKLSFTGKKLNIKLSSVLNGNVSVNTSVYAVTYTNEKLSENPIFNLTQSLIVDKNNISTVNVDLSKLVPGKTNYFQCIVNVKYPDNETHMAQKTLYVTPVSVNINVEKCCTITDNGGPKNVTFSITNTTPISMSNVVLNVKNKHLHIHLHKKIGTILPGKSVTIKSTMHVDLKGRHKTRTVLIAKIKYAESHDKGKGSVGLKIKQ